MTDLLHAVLADNKYTKAGMLRYLQEHLPDINILPIFVVNSDDFFHDTVTTVNSIVKFSQRGGADCAFLLYSGGYEPVF